MCLADIFLYWKENEFIFIFIFIYIFILGCRGVPNLFRGASLGPRALLQERSRHLSALPGEGKHLLLPFLQGIVFLNFFWLPPLFKTVFRIQIRIGSGFDQNPDPGGQI
jgi:hypothetical protein